MRRARRGALASLLAALLVPAVARGDASEPLAVALTAPAACPATPRLLDRVRSHTTHVREPAGDESARQLEVVVRAEGHGFVADLRLVDDADVLARRVPGRTCEEVLAAVALIAALAIDAREPRPEVSEHHAPATPLAPPTHVVFAPEPAPAPPSRSRITARLGVTFEVQGLGAPVVTEAAWVEGALASRLAPSLRLRVGQSRSFTEEALGHAASFRLRTGALDGCVRLAESGRLSLRPCVQLTGGALAAASAAFGPTRRAVRPWFTAGALAQGRWAFFGPLALEASFGVALPFVRESFYFLPHTGIYRAPPAILLGNVGLGTTFR